MGMVVDSYRFAAAGVDWRDHVYDYWDEGQATAGQNMTSALSAVSGSIPVLTKTSDGFTITPTTVANTDTNFKYVVAVGTVRGTNGGNGYTTVTRTHANGFTYRLLLGFYDGPSSGWDHALAGNSYGLSLPNGGATYYIPIGDSFLMIAGCDGATSKHWWAIGDTGLGHATGSTAGMAPVNFAFGQPSNTTFRMFAALSGDPSAEFLEGVADEYGITTT